MKTAFSVLAGVLILSTVACDLVFSPTTEFVIRVDRIIAPETIQPGDVLEARFVGYVGSDQCSQLVRVDRNVSSTGIEIRFRGERRRGGCAQLPVMLEHDEQIHPPLDDPFTITVLQPTGPPLVHTVRIKVSG